MPQVAYEPNETCFRIRFSLKGGHVHCRLFAAKDPRQTFAKCGDFTVRRGAEFRDLLFQFNRAEALPDNDSDGGIDAATTE